MKIINELRTEFKLPHLLQAAKMPRTSYYYQRKIASRPREYAIERTELRQICTENKGRYGYRRATLALREIGAHMNHKVVMRLMSEEGLTCRLRAKRYRSSVEMLNYTTPDLIKRNFKADRPNRKWVTDITEFKLFGKKMYLSVVLDLYCREVVGYELSKRSTYEMVDSSLQKALARVKVGDGLILHSDHGWHYKMAEHLNTLSRYGIRQSMSRKGNCYDNCVIENFFGMLKTEFYDNQKFSSIEEFGAELEKFMQYYNNVRIKCDLKGSSPTSYRASRFPMTI